MSDLFPTFFKITTKAWLVLFLFALGLFVFFSLAGVLVFSLHVATEAALLLFFKNEMK